MSITLDGESVWESGAIVADFQKATTFEDPESDINLRRAVLGSVRYKLVDDQRERGPLFHGDRSGIALQGTVSGRTGAYHRQQLLQYLLNVDVQLHAAVR